MVGLIVMSFQSIEEMRVYQRAEEVADEIWDIAATWPYFVQRSVGLQLVRAADSIGANIAEGMGRIHPKDVCKFLYYSRGSLRETIFWIRRARKRLLMDDEVAKKLLDALDNLARELNATIKFQKSRPTI